MYHLIQVIAAAVIAAAVVNKILLVKEDQNGGFL